MTKDKGRRLKELQVMRQQFAEEVSAAKSNLCNAQHCYNNYLNKAAEVEAEIKRLSQAEIVVSEHAILRYVERAMGLDVEQIKEQILSKPIRSAINNGGNGKYPINEGLKAVVHNNVVVTVR